jgi:hypothetical protein
VIDLTFPVARHCESVVSPRRSVRTKENTRAQICRLSGALAGALLLLATAVDAQPLLSPDPNVPLSSCWVELRPFSNLRYGNFTYCRTSLRYRPGRLDCAQFLDQACWVLLPGATQWALTRANQSRALIPCPNGPEPPVCPRLGP